MTESNTPSHKQAKADAKAAKAYAKAQRPLYKKKRVIIPAALVALVGFNAATSGGEDETPVATEVVAAPAEAPESEAAPVETEAPAPAPAPEPKEKPVKVDAETILSEFEGNEAAGDAKYKGKTLQVTGNVSKVDTEFWDEEQYTVMLDNGDEWAVWTVNCNDVTADVAATVTPKTTVTVVGEFDDGGDLGVELKNCTIK